MTAPPKVLEEQHTEVIVAKVKPTQKEQFKAAAALRGMGLSTWIRVQLTDSVRRMEGGR